MTDSIRWDIDGALKMDDKQLLAAKLSYLITFFRSRLGTDFVLQTSKTTWEAILDTWPHQYMPRVVSPDEAPLITVPADKIAALRDEMIKRQAIPMEGLWYDVQVI